MSKFVVDFEHLKARIKEHSSRTMKNNDEESYARISMLGEDPSRTDHHNHHLSHPDLPYHQDIMTKSD